MVNFKTLRESMNPTAQESTGIIDEMKEDVSYLDERRLQI